MNFQPKYLGIESIDPNNEQKTQEAVKLLFTKSYPRAQVAPERLKRGAAVLLLE